MKSVLKWLNQDLEVFLGTICSVVMFALLLVQVVSRYVFKYAIPWSEEIAVILFIASIYFGCAAAVVKDQHLKIELVSFLPKKVQRILLIVANLIFIGFCIYMCFPFATLIQNLHRSGAATAVTRIPKWMIYCVMPLGMLLTSFRVVQATLRILADPHILDKPKKKGLLELDA
ncbi:MAG: TRAP transporter small permease [Clostridia bacterium]|nr:TRAP transporter small permease [Clostridia bacterium]